MKKKTESGFITEAIVLAAVLLLTLPLRTVQYYSIIEAGTGFYTKVTATVWIFFAVIAAAFVYFLISGIAKRKKYTLEAATDKPKAGNGILAILSGLAIGISVVQEYMLKDVDNSAYTVSSTVSGSVSSLLLYVQEIFGVLAAIYFILVGISFLSCRSSASYKLLSLTPVIWNIIRLVTRFTRTISYIRVSDLMLEMLMMVCFAMFFMAFAQCNSQVNGEGNEWKLSVFGLTGAMLGLICFVPRAILTLTGHSSAIYALSRADVSDCALSLFAVATVVTRMVPKKSGIVKVTEKEAE